MASSSSSSSSSLLPTVDDVSADDFMKQLGHASRIIPLLHPHPITEEEEGADDDDNAPSDALLLEVLSSQFGHSDGIRGFFATYLTSPESLTTAGEDDVPPILAEAVRGADTKVMVPLACMNVVMPTAMSSIHQDAELKECASKTAANGKKILRLLKDNDDVIGNCRAITSVCRGLSSSEEGGGSSGGDDHYLVEYWEKFFVNYKYKDEQKNDIAVAMSEFC